MSYILEALKKAQAERQLGTLPTIHAPQLQGRDGAAGVHLKKPLWLATGLTALVVVTLALLWRQPWQGALPVAPLQAPATAPLTVVTVVPPSVVPPSVTPLPVVPNPVLVLPAVAVKPAMAKVVVPDAQSLMMSRVAVPPPLEARAAAPALPVVRPSVPAGANVVTEDSVLSLRELPEPIQRQIAPLAIGGYIYSRNPADRLLLVDKVLRHEGEEVGPGLTLEKLQPKSAVFNFKGYRYRVPY